MTRFHLFLIMFLFVVACAPALEHEGPGDGGLEELQSDANETTGNDEPSVNDDGFIGRDPDTLPDTGVDGDADADQDDELDADSCGDADSWGDADQSVDGDLEQDAEPDDEHGEDCVEGETRPCGSELGECEEGAHPCIDGFWGPCLGARGPREETCDDRDDDCDGEVDEGSNPCGGACALSNPPGRPCDGPDTDLCLDDAYECSGLNTTRCSTGPNDTEICNDHDDDCDGEVDEGCPPPGCTDECDAAGVTVTGGTYRYCQPWGDEDSCLDLSGPFECLADSGGRCSTPACPFTAPRLASPADGASVAAGSVTFCFGVVAGGPAGYNVSISRSPSMIPDHIDRGAYCIPSAEWSTVYLRGSTTGTCRTFTLHRGDVVYWHVQACSMAACGPWSAARRLEVE